MKKYAYIDKYGRYRLDTEFNAEKVKNSYEFQKIIETIKDPYGNMQLYKQILKNINPNYTDLSQEVLNRSNYLDFVIQNPSSIYGLFEVYTIDNIEDCMYLISISNNIPENYFFIENKEKLELLRDAIIDSDKFVNNIDENIANDESYNSIRMYMSYKCPELIIGLSFKAVRGDVGYLICSF